MLSKRNIKVQNMTEKKNIGESIEYENPNDRSVTATCGCSSTIFQLAGETVAYSRVALASILNIEKDSIALVNGEEVQEDHLLEVRDRLEFVKKSGEKGV
jgi:hypothetical protein